MTKQQHFLVRTALFAALLTLIGVPAKAQQHVKFTLDWALQGNHAIWSLAQQRGYFAKQGLVVQMDRGYGSGDTIIKVAGGAYDIGFADINGLVKFDADHPGQRVISVYQVFDRTLGAVITLSKSGIKTPKELAGHTIGAPEGEASRVLFPPFAVANGIDPNSMHWISMAPNLRETMLAEGRVDAITGFVSTSLFNLIAAGVPRDQIIIFPYADYHVDLYGSALIVRADYAKTHGDLLRRFIRATIEGEDAAIRDPAAGMASLQKLEPLLDAKLEAARWKLVLDQAILTPYIKKHGFGSINPARMAETVAVNAKVYKIAHPPKPDQIYTTKFLPPAAERMPPQ